MGDIVLDFNNVGKLYSLRSVGTGSFTNDIHRWWTMNILGKADPREQLGEINLRDIKGKSDYVWALKDVSFQVRRGEVIGLIGQNGSGKSTLFKILSRITTPTTGTIKIKGRVASLLEVGTGFHPDLTGRDNIFMNGAILGMSKSEIKRKFDEIVDFSGIERYIDTPVKRYSSGMTVRLGFSVAAFLEPEILVVDEVLAVGDVDYRRKAIKKMKDISSQEGRTVLFVSHSMPNLLKLCNRGIILDSGRLSFDGPIEGAVNIYQGKPVLCTSFEGNDGVDEVMKLTRAELSSPGANEEVFTASQPICLEFEVVIAKPIDQLVVGFNLLNQYDTPLARGDYNDFSGATTLEPGKYRMRYQIPPYTLGPGRYQLSFDIAERDVKQYTTTASNLAFEVVVDNDNFGYVFKDLSPRKMSVFHPKWLTAVDRLE